MNDEPKDQAARNPAARALLVETFQRVFDLIATMDADAIEQVVLRVSKAFPKPAPPGQPSKRYAGKKKALSLSVSSDLTSLGIQYFPLTKYRSLSGFLAAKLTSEFRMNAPRIRKAGLKLPDGLFDED